MAQNDDGIERFLAQLPPQIRTPDVNSDVRDPSTVWLLRKRSRHFA